MAGETSSLKPNRKGCTVLKVYAADWMLPDNISIKDGGSCNVLVLVPYGYPGEDDNAEILGALVTNMLDCYAMVNNRLYFRQGRDRPNKLKSDLGSLAGAKGVYDYWLVLSEFLKGIPTRYESPVIVIFIHAMEDSATDRFNGDLMFTLGKGFVGEYDETKASGSEEFFEDLLQNLRQVSVVTDEFEEYAQPCTLPVELRKEFGKNVEAATIAVRCERCRDSIPHLQSTATLIANAIKELSLFKQTVDREPIYFADSGDVIADEEDIETIGGMKYTLVRPRTSETKMGGKSEFESTEEPLRSKDDSDGANTTEENLWDEASFLYAADLSPRALKKFEARYIAYAKMSKGIKYYSGETLKLVKAMNSCLGRCANLDEAYDMALSGISSKKRRNEQIATIRNGDNGQWKNMDPKEIKTHPTFEGLLPIDEELLERITKDMVLNGYSASTPIVLGTWPERQEPACIDGHTRIRAAIAARIGQVPVIIEAFDNEAAAVEYVMNVQTNRRITKDRDIFRLIERYDSVMRRGGDRRSEQAKSKPITLGREKGRSASAIRTAKIVGCNRGKVENARKILKDGSPEIQDAVRKGEKSINNAYNEIIGKGKKTQTAAIKISDKNLAALQKLDGDLHHHVNLAVEQYLRRLQNQEEAPEKEAPTQ